ncbi:MAG TPA: branched-chain amino acid ABC transporter permease [Verrucomicrobiae bacterium]|nr:branched-chain amino acid ABC transporter permease [Verrucomicrobiae bacterium]
MPARSHFLLLAALLVSFVLDRFASQLNPYYLDICTNVGINIILAVSLNLINGFTGQFSLGHAGFMAVGAYTSASVTMFLGPHLPLGMGGPLLFLPALLAGGAMAALAGLMVGVPSLRLTGDYLAIVTLGFGEIIRVIFRNMESVGGSLGLQGIPDYTTPFWTFSFAALTIYVVSSLVNSTYGRGFIAVHDDEVAASAMGINPTKYKIIAFIVGAFFAGVAGGIYGHFKLSIDPKGFDFVKSIEIVVMVILGGMGNNVGVVLAAILLTLLPEFLRTMAGWSLPNPFGSHSVSLRWIAETRMIIYSLLIVVLMLVRPQGLFTLSLGRHRKKEGP